MMKEEEVRKLAEDYIDSCTKKSGFVILAESLKGDFIDLFVAGFMKCLEIDKPNGWHYPSKGEYPKANQLVLGIFQNSEYYTPTELVYYSKELDCWSNQMGDSEYHNIVAWKEIVLPEQEG